MVTPEAVGVPLISPAEFNVSPGAGGAPFIGVPVVMTNGGGGGGGAAGSGFDTLSVSLQALRTKGTARKRRKAPNMFLVAVRSCTRALPLSRIS